MCDLLIVGFCKCMIIAFGLKEVGVVSEDICVVAALDGFLIVQISHMMISADGMEEVGELAEVGRVLSIGFHSTLVVNFSSIVIVLHLCNKCSIAAEDVGIIRCVV